MGAALGQYFVTFIQTRVEDTRGKNASWDAVFYMLMAMTAASAICIAHLTWKVRVCACASVRACVVSVPSLPVLPPTPPLGVARHEEAEEGVACGVSVGDLALLPFRPLQK